MICHHCGGLLRQAVTRKPVKGVRKLLPLGPQGTQEVWTHKSCSKAWDRDHARYTAMPNEDLGHEG